MTELQHAFPLLQTERLNLVAIEEEHASGLYQLFTDPRVTAFYPVFQMQEEKDALNIVTMLRQKFIERTAIRWAITLKGSKELVGVVGYSSFTRGHRASLVYALMPHLWGKGYVTEAIKEVMKYGFETIGANRIDAEVMPGNTASEKVLEKLGFAHEGLLRQWFFWNDGYFDVNMYACLRTSWCEVLSIK